MSSNYGSQKPDHLKNVPNLLAKRFVFRGTKIVLARRTGSLSVCNEDYVLTQALFQKKWNITLLYSTKHHSKRRSTSHKGHIASRGLNQAKGVQILMMNALAERPRDGMINWTATPIKNDYQTKGGRRSDGTLHCPLQTPTHFIQVFLSRRKTSEI